jgi:hypothetical protein
MGGENATLHGWVGMCMHPRPRKRRPGGTFRAGKVDGRTGAAAIAAAIRFYFYYMAPTYTTILKKDTSKIKESKREKNKTLLIQLDPSLKENNGKSRDQRDQPTFHKQRKAKPQNPTLPPSNPVVFPSHSHSFSSARQTTPLHRSPTPPPRLRHASAFRYRSGWEGRCTLYSSTEWQYQYQ